MNTEQLLQLWFETNPTAKSPYKLYGNPPMWKTMERNGLILFTRPTRTMIFKVGDGWEEVDGVAYQFQKGGKWVGQGYSTSFRAFEKRFNND